MSEPMMDGPGTRVVIVDDDSTVRVMLRQILSAERDFEVVGEAESGEKALEAIQVLHPDAVVLDDQTPDAAGAEALRRAAAELPSVRLVSLSLAELRKIAPEMVKTGAHLSLDKKTQAVDHLLADLRTRLN